MEEFNGIDIVRKAVEALKAAGADKAQAGLSRGEQSELNIDAGRMSLYRTTVNVSIGLTAHVGGRKGSISVNKYDDAAIQEAAADAIAMARSSEPDPANDISPARPLERFRHGPLEPDNTAMYDRLREFIDWAASSYPKTRLEQCVLDFGRGESFYANSNGAEFEDRSGQYSFFAMFTSKEGANASSFNYSGAAHRSLALPLKNWGTIDTLMRQSSEQTRVEPVKGSFEGDIIVTPDCLGDFLGYIDGVYLSDYALITGNSPWKDMMGKPVVSPLLTIRSEPDGAAVEVGYSYTGDGFRAENCPIIERGALRNFTLGLYGRNQPGRHGPRCQKRPTPGAFLRRFPFGQWRFLWRSQELVPCGKRQDRQACRRDHDCGKRSQAVPVRAGRLKGAGRLWLGSASLDNDRGHQYIGQIACLWAGRA